MNEAEKPRSARLAVSVPEAAAMLGIGRTKAFEAIREGSLPAVRIGRRVLVPLARLKAMLGEPPEGKDSGDAA